MEPKFDQERVKEIAGWTFLQWAHAAAYMALRSPGAALPAATLEGLLQVQRYWLERHSGDMPPRLGFMERVYYRWAWTCAAFAAAAGELHPHLRRTEPDD